MKLMKENLDEEKDKKKPKQDLDLKDIKYKKL